MEPPEFGATADPQRVAADAEALAHARRLVAAAQAELDGIRAATHGLDAATAWSSRAADAYRAALADWVRATAILATFADDAAAELRRAAHVVVGVP